MRYGLAGIGDASRASIPPRWAVVHGGQGTGVSRLLSAILRRHSELPT